MPRRNRLSDRIVGIVRFRRKDLKGKGHRLAVDDIDDFS